MRYRELLEAADDPMPGSGHVFYHVTTDTRLKSIMANGLEPGHHRRWKNVFGSHLGDRGFVYLISDFTEAVRFAARQNYYFELDGKKAKTLILALQNVPTEGLERDSNIEGQLAGHSWYRTPGVIPPQDIARVIPLTPELAQQAVQVVGNDQAPEEPPPTEGAALSSFTKTAWRRVTA